VKEERERPWSTSGSIAVYVSISRDSALCSEGRTENEQPAKGEQELSAGVKRSIDVARAPQHSLQGRDLDAALPSAGHCRTSSNVVVLGKTRKRFCFLAHILRAEFLVITEHGLYEPPVTEAWLQRTITQRRKRRSRTHITN